MASYSLEADDSLNFSDAVQVSYGVTVVDRVLMTSPLAALFGVLITEDVEVADVMTRVYAADGRIAETINLAPGISISMAFFPVAADAIAVHSALLVAYPKIITESIVVEESTQITQALTIVSHMSIGAGVLAPLKMSATLTDTAALFAAVAFQLGGFLTDNFHVQAVASVLRRVTATVASTINVEAIQNGWMVTSQIITDELEITNTELVRMIYDGQLTDELCITVSYVEPGQDGITTWAINTRTGAVTEYQNYAFNSMARMGNFYLGADTDGLWRMDGDLDDTAAIPARVRTGYGQFNGSRFASVSEAYIGLNVTDPSGNFFLRILTKDGRDYVFAVTPQDGMTTKVDTGKGIRSRYLAWELATTGGDFDLDTVEFVPIMAKRRV